MPPQQDHCLIHTVTVLSTQVFLKHPIFSIVVCSISVLFAAPCPAVRKALYADAICLYVGVGWAAPRLPLGVCKCVPLELQLMVLLSLSLQGPRDVGEKAHALLASKHVYLK